MKKIFVFIFAVSVLVFSCKEETRTTDGNASDSAFVYVDTTERKVLEGYSEEFKKIMKSDSGLIRGIGPGSPLSDVLKMEDTTALDEESKDYLLYAINYNFPETAEVSYFHKQNVIEKIELVVYPKDKNSQAKLFSEFEKFYTTQLGEPTKKAPNNIQWDNQVRDVRILLEKKDNQHVHDIILGCERISKGTVSSL